MYLEAIEQYEKAMKSDPSLHVAYLSTGLSYFNLIRKGAKEKEEQYANEAVRYFLEYIEKVPEDEKKIAEYVINVYTDTGQFEKAVDYLKETLEKEPDNLESIKAIAKIYLDSNQFEKSLDWNKRAAGVDSQNPEAWYTVGVMCWQKSRHGGEMPIEERTRYVEEGIESLNKAISMKNDYVDAIVYLGLLLREKAGKIVKDEAEKEKLIEKAVTLQKQAIALKKLQDQAALEAEAKAAKEAEKGQ
jgi:tetratricopeptide (TPR) repeat protein